MIETFAGRSQNSGGERNTAQPRGPTHVQTRSERREGGRRGGEIPRQVGANLIRNPARSESEATPWLQPACREGHGPTSLRWGWSSCVLRSTIPPTSIGCRPEMKIDFGLLDRLEAAGATARVIIEMLRAQHDVDEAKKIIKRPKDAKRKRERPRATKGGNVATVSDQERLEATVSDTPRARLFREGKPALLTLNISDSRAGALIVGWLKLTSDDDQLVLATILKAQSLAVADAPSWILATLKGKTNGNGTGDHRANQAAGQSGSATIMAGVAAAAERRGRERAADRSGGKVPGDADATREPDFEFGGTSHG